jgi:NAD(P)-dependent dehydrogenase (short-subunit alcohol dehydrogenase family)
MSKVLILGGYGNFGKRIARLLTRHNVPVIIAGRDANKGKILAQALPVGLAEIAIFDVRQTLPVQLKALTPTVVINTCGPFQTSDYAVAETCIEHGAHYIDLADALEFVTNVRTLDGKAKRNQRCGHKRRQHRPGVDLGGYRASSAAILRNRIARLRHCAGAEGGTRSRHDISHFGLRGQKIEALCRV